MGVAQDSDVYAKDIVPEWRKLIRKSKESIVMVSPYLDGLVLGLLRQSPLLPNASTVLTDISPTSSARTYRNQLEVLLKLVEAGYIVKSLARVHAKILISDWEFVCFGSQNFTKYARKSKEVSAATTSMTESSLLCTVREWINEGEMVSIDLLNELIEGIDGELLRAEESDDVLVKRVKAIRESFIPPKVAAFRSWREGLSARVGEIINNEEMLYSSLSKSARVTYPSGKHYKSLMSDWSNLTQWWRLNEAEERSVEFINLEKLSMYPILFSDTGIMGFARLAASRITYIRGAVNWGPMRIQNLTFYVSVNFPRNIDRSSNVNLILKPNGNEAFAINLELIFDGVSLTHVGDNLDEKFSSEKPLSPTQQLLCDIYLDHITVARNFRIDEVSLYKVFSVATRPFQYSGGLRIERHNITDYAMGSRYRIGLVQPNGLTCLVAQCMDGTIND